MNYNVLTESWIPARLPDGSIREYGVLDLLEHAHELVEITDAMPNYEFGMYRFLFVFLMDAYHPKRQRDIRALLEEGSFDMELIRGYVEECNRDGERFDLLDETHPFMQQAEGWDRKAEVKSIAKLNPAMPSGSNHVHFEHTFEADAELSLSQAAKALTAINVFAGCDGKGYQAALSASASGTCIPVYTIVKGDNLFETLVFGLSSSLMDEDYYSDDTKKDFPIWRNDSYQNYEEYPHAIVFKLFGLTFPVRYVRLNYSNDTLRSINWASGLKYKYKDKTANGSELTISWKDPYVSYKYDTKGLRVAVASKLDDRNWLDIGSIFNVYEQTLNEQPLKPTAPEVVVAYQELQRPLINVCTYTCFNRAGKGDIYDIKRNEYIFSNKIMGSNMLFEFFLNVGLGTVKKYGEKLEKALISVQVAVLHIKKKEENLKKTVYAAERTRTLNRYYSDTYHQVMEYLCPVLEKSQMSELGELQEEWNHRISAIQTENYNEFVDRISVNSRLYFEIEKARKEKDS